MSNKIQVIQDKAGNNVFPITHEKAVRDSSGVSLEAKLSALESKTYIEAWDGASTPVVANIPAGVVVSYNGTNYTGTLAASSSTDGKIYLVKDGTEYDRYASSINLGGTYMWSYLGTTAMSLSGYATEDELGQLEQKVSSLDDMRVSEVIPASVGKNLYNPAAVTEDVRILANTGAEYSNTGYNATEFINISGQTKITVSFTTSVTSGFVVAFYNASKVYISGASTTVNTTDSVTTRKYTVIDVPANAEYVRASSQIFELRKFMLENGSSPSAYEEYSYTPERTVEHFKDSAMPPSYGPISSASVGGVLTRQSQALADGQSIELEQNSVKSFTLAFYGKFGTFGAIRLGHGTGGHSQFFDVDDEKITLYLDGEQGNFLEHGLTISEYISILLIVKSNCDYTIKIETLNGSYSRNFNKPSVWTGNKGNMFCSSIGTIFTFASLTFSAPFQKSKWLFGDSYVSNYSDRRWPYYIQNWGFDNTLISGVPGENSAEAYVDWTSSLAHGKPKYVIWALGMNDPDSGGVNAAWKAAVDKLIVDCETYGITPIFCTIPNVPSYNHTYKNAWIKASGYRYIDFAEAVDAETAGATWPTGCLSTDNVHPTENGARLLATRALQDFPEFMQE